MVLVAVCQNKTLDLIRVADKIGDVVDDEVNAEHIVVRKAEAAVDDEDAVAVFKHGKVLADLAETAQRDHAQFFEFSFGSRHRMIPFLIGCILNEKAELGYDEKS
jgi:ribosome biogenesis protein Tsr3